MLTSLHSSLERPSPLIRRLVLALAVCVGGNTSCAQAQTASPVEEIPFTWDLGLVRTLRDARDFETALSLVERLAKEYPEKASLLAFEQARVLVDQAAIEPDPIRRERQRRQARTVLQNQLAAQPMAPQAVESRVWLARVDMQLARAQLARVLPLVALPPDNVPAQSEKVKARKSLADSGKKLADAVAAARRVIQGPNSDPAFVERLGPLLSRADLEVALSHFDAARTFNPQREADQRLVEVKKAQELLTGLKSSGETNPVSFIAGAYLGLLLRENGEPQKARAELRPLLTATEPEKAEARRLARVFNMEVLLRDGFDPTERGPRTPDQVVEDLGFAWLSDYRRYGKTPEASAVRMLVAESIVTQLRKLSKTPANQRLREDRYLQIRRLVREIEKGDNEYTEKARRLKIAILQEQGVFNKKLEDLKTFDDCLARAQFELVRMAEETAEAKEISARQDAEKKRQVGALDALRRAIQLDQSASPKDKALPEEINQAKYTRIFLANALGLHEEAIRQGEEFARNDPRPSQAIMSGAVALQSHLSIMEEAKRKITSLDAMEKGGQKVETKDRESSRKELADATASMVRFAEYLVTRWPEEELANTCRLQIGLARIREGKYAEALPVLEQVGLESRVRPLALMQSALVHYQLAERKSADAQGKASETAKAIGLLRQIPAVSDISDRALTDNYLQSRLRLAGEYYTAKDFPSLSSVLGELDAIRAKLDEDSRNAYGAMFQRADLYSVLLTMNQAAGLKDISAQADLLDRGLQRLAKAKSGLSSKSTLAAFLDRALTASLLANRPDMSDRVITLSVELAGASPLEEDCQNLAKSLFSTSRRVLSPSVSPDPERREAMASRLSELLRKVPEKMQVGDATKRMLAGAFESVGAARKAGGQDYGRALKLLEPVARPLLENPGELAAARDKHPLVVSYLRLHRLTGQIELERSLLSKAMEPGAWGARNLEVALEDIHCLLAEKKFGMATRKVKPIVDQLEAKVQAVGANPGQSDRVYVDRYTEAAALQIIAFEGYGRTNKDTQSSLRAATLMVDLEKRPWFSQAPDIWLRRLADLGEQSPDFRANCEKFRKGK